MSDRRVVITGIGAVTPLGPSLGATLDALAAGKSAVREATLFDATGFACANAAEVRNWDPRPSFRVPKALKLTDRPARFAVAAAEMALDHARWPRDEHRLDALGVVIGSSGSDLQVPDIGRALAGDEDARSATDIAYFAERMLSGLNPLWLLVSLPNMTSAHVAIQLQARGPNSTIMSDWVAGHQAIGEAAEWIRSGEADAVLAGGADSAIQPLAYAACQQAGFFEADQDGDGLVPAEGAALFLLEERDAACARGATILGELHALLDPRGRQRVPRRAGAIDRGCGDGRRLDARRDLDVRGGRARTCRHSRAPPGTRSNRRSGRCRRAWHSSRASAIRSPRPDPSTRRSNWPARCAAGGFCPAPSAAPAKR